MKRILLSTLVTIVFALPAAGQQVEMPMHENIGGHRAIQSHGSMDRMGEMMGSCLDHGTELGLKDDQIKKLTPIHREMKKLQVRFRADLQLAEMEQMEIMEVKDFDLDKAIAGDKKIADLKCAYHVELLKSMKEVRSILSEEQFRKMKSLQEKMKQGKKPAKGKQRRH